MVAPELAENGPGRVLKLDVVLLGEPVESARGIVVSNCPSSNARTPAWWGDSPLP